MPTTTRRAPGGLAAELAALANPAPTPMRTELPDDDFDPSGGAVDPADDSSDGFSGDDDSDGGGDDGDRDDGVLRPTRADRDAGTGGKLRMRAGIALDDEEYVGKSSSRRAMERAWAGEDQDEDDDDDEDDDLDDVDEEALMQDESEDDEEDEEEEEEEEEEDLEEDEEEDEDDDSDGNDAAMLGDGYGINGEDEQMDDDDDDSDDDSDDDAEDDADAYADDSAGGGSGDDPELEAELAAFREEEAEANRLAAARSKNAVKGAAVRRQNDAWERSLRARILLQRGVNAAAKFPTPAYMAALKASDEGVAPAAATAAGAARGALSALLRLQAALMDGNPAIAAAAAEEDADADADAAIADGGKKRKTRSATAELSRMHLMASPASEVWKAADSMYARYAAFRDRSCDRWHRKAQVSVGKMAGGGGPGGRGGGGGEMRAFNQSLSAQVQSAMRLPERLVSRSQPPSHLAPRRLGEPAAAAAEDATAPAEDGDEDGALAAAAAAKEGERRVAELYDDADFYEQVLKEFLESAGAGGLGGAAAAAKPPKRRKVVDRRASKGRKLRYHIQQPLVNFCAPVELEVPAWAEKVFGQLFASKA